MMKGIQGKMVWIVISLIIMLAALGIFIMMTPNMIDSLTAFSAEMMSWMRGLW